MSKKRLKTKNLTWEVVYQLPIEYDNIGYCWTKNGVMALMFDFDISEEDRNKITNVINGEDESKIEGLTKDGVDFYQDGIFIFCVRGWGNLTGTGALSLTEQDAMIIQDGFIEYVYNKLK